ncbi:unnamed protein product [Clonostachys chloroleuca]|uniref:Uncharacterized protein n=1 Tax=Clonostachys chloroleuca TaxID=1926264 RepID=A0AA35QGE0_9HYPO|nr:unnamed protein product [Clonostachys chloroleuca]
MDYIVIHGDATSRRDNSVCRKWFEYSTKNISLRPRYAFVGALLIALENGQRLKVQNGSLVKYHPEFENGSVPAEVIRQPQHKSGGSAKCGTPAANSSKKQ